jgi:hypothetical protein
VKVLKSRFKLAGLIALIGLGAITIILTPLVNASNANQNIIIDANESADRKDSTTWNPNQIRGELWAAYATYDMSYIEVDLRKDGSPGDINLIVQEAPDGIPSGNNIALLTIPAKNIPAEKSWVRFNTTNVSIIQGNKYWFGIYASSGKANVDQYALAMSEGSSYTNGISVNLSDGIWQPSENYDCLFRIFGLGASVKKTTARIVPPSAAPFINAPRVATKPTATPPANECSLPWSAIVFILCCLGIIRGSRAVLRK